MLWLSLLLAVTTSAADQATRLCEAGRYHAALAAFDQAIREDPRPALFFGRGQCQVRSGDRDGAASSLRRYLELDINAPDREEVTARIRALESRQPPSLRFQTGLAGAWFPGRTTGLASSLHLIATQRWGFLALGAGRQGYALPDGAGAGAGAGTGTTRALLVYELHAGVSLRRRLSPTLALALELGPGLLVLSGGAWSGLPTDNPFTTTTRPDPRTDVVHRDPTASPVVFPAFRLALPLRLVLVDPFFIVASPSLTVTARLGKPVAAPLLLGLALGLGLRL